MTWRSRPTPCAMPQRTPESLSHRVASHAVPPNLPRGDTSNHLRVEG
jgi:hypothetical protein